MDQRAVVHPHNESSKTETADACCSVDESQTHAQTFQAQKRHTV